MSPDTLGMIGDGVLLGGITVAVFGAVWHSIYCPHRTVYDEISLYLALAGSVILVAASIMHHDWIGAGVFTIGFGLFVRLWWRRRKQRKIAMKLVGDKTKRILASMVKKIRSLPKPARRLQPA